MNSLSTSLPGKVSDIGGHHFARSLRFFLHRQRSPDDTNPDIGTLKVTDVGSKVSNMDLNPEDS